MLVRRKLLKVYKISVLSLIVILALTFSAFPSFALSSDDASVVLSTLKPSGVYAWLCRGHSNNFTYVKQLQSPTLNYPSIYKFRSQAYFDYTSSFGSTQNITLTYFEYNQMFEYQSGYVYSIDITLTHNPSETDYIFDADLSKFLFVLPVANVPNSDFGYGSFSTYFYNGYAPAKIVKNSSNIVLTYNIAVYPETTFSRSIPTNGVYEMAGFALQDFGTGLVHSTISPDGTFYRYSQLIICQSLDCNVYTSDQFANISLQNELGGISDQIDSSTGEIISAMEQQTDDILNAGDPVDISDLEAAHQTEHDLANVINSTLPYSASTAGRMFDIMNRDYSDLTYVRTWMQAVYENNEMVQISVSLSLLVFACYMAFKAVF